MHFVQFTWSWQLESLWLITWFECFFESLLLGSKVFHNKVLIKSFSENVQRNRSQSVTQKLGEKFSPSATMLGDWSFVMSVKWSLLNNRLPSWVQRNYQIVRRLASLTTYVNRTFSTTVFLPLKRKKGVLIQDYQQTPSWLELENQPDANQFTTSPSDLILSPETGCELCTLCTRAEVPKSTHYNPPTPNCPSSSHSWISKQQFVDLGLK